MTTELQTTQHATPEQAEVMTASLLDLQHQPITNQTEADKVSQTVSHLTTPATRKWIAGRVATVLSQYFVSSVPAEVMQAVAEDWQHELKDYPAWAINAACRWWMGSENEKRRQRPLPGDIAARAHEEMMPVRFASLKLKSFNRSEHQPPAQVITHDRFVDIEGKRERADDILKKAGFTPRRFGGAQ